jgi:endogenous inhibitor of DNA gyrase (YacG/DUF329 family)
MTVLQKEHITQMRTRGDSYSKIAVALSISENTVKSFCRRNNLTGNLSIKPAKPTDEGKYCKQCGKEIQQEPKKKQRKFCSDECRIIWWTANPEKLNKKANYEFVCAYCGAKFTAYGNKGRKYCTHACYVEERFKKAVAV